MLAGGTVVMSFMDRANNSLSRNIKRSRATAGVVWFGSQWLHIRFYWEMLYPQVINCGLNTRYRYTIESLNYPTIHEERLWACLNIFNRTNIKTAFQPFKTSLIILRNPKTAQTRSKWKELSTKLSACLAILLTLNRRNKKIIMMEVTWYWKQTRHRSCPECTCVS